MWVLKESCSSFRLLSCFWKGRHFETGVSFSRGHVSEFGRCSLVSQRMRPSFGLCLESRLGPNRCVEGVKVGCMGGSLCSGGDVMNRSGESCVYQWLCSGWKCGSVHLKCSDWYPGKVVQFQRLYLSIAERDENWRQRQCNPQVQHGYNSRCLPHRRCISCVAEVLYQCISDRFVLLRILQKDTPNLGPFCCPWHPSHVMVELKQLVFQGCSPCESLVEDKNVMSLGSVKSQYWAKVSPLCQLKRVLMNIEWRLIVKSFTVASVCVPISTMEKRVSPKPHRTLVTHLIIWRDVIFRNYPFIEQQRVDLDTTRGQIHSDRSLRRPLPPRC